MNYIDKEKRKTGGKFLYPYFNRHSVNSLINNAGIATAKSWWREKNCPIVSNNERNNGDKVKTNGGRNVREM